MEKFDQTFEIHRWKSLLKKCLVLLVVLGQNGSGQNGTDKMVYEQNGIGQNGMDKMVQTKWYGQNGSNFLYRF